MDGKNENSIVLLRPNHRSHIITPVLALGYLSGALKEQGFDVLVIDALREGLTETQIMARVGNPLLIGISVLTEYAPTSFRIAQRLVERGHTVVLGGPHITSLPVESLKGSGAQFVLRGEGEIALPRLAKNIRQGKVESFPGLVKAGDAVALDYDLIPDLDQIPAPDWTPSNLLQYPQAVHGAVSKAFPAAPVITSRGCSFPCAFCANPSLWKKRVRFKSPSLVVDEIEDLKRMGVREIHFEDNNLTLKADHVRGVCEELVRRNIALPWATPNGTRTEGLTPELLRLMKESGCYHLAFGVETSDPAILKAMDKRSDAENLKRVIRQAEAEGIITQGFFILGLPGETKKNLRRLPDYAIDLGLSRAQFHFLDILPGTRLYENPPEGQIDKSARSFHQVQYVPKGLSKADLEKARRRAFFKFYLRPKSLWSILRFVRPLGIAHFVRRLFDFHLLPFRKTNQDS